MLQPISMTFGILALADFKADSGTITLHISEDSCELQIADGGGIVTLRSLEVYTKEGSGAGKLDLETLARQLRITLGQMPHELQDQIHAINIFGPDEMLVDTISGLRSLLAPLNLSVTKGSSIAAGYFDIPEKANQFLPALTAATANLAIGQRSAMEFLPSRTSQLKQMANRMSARAAFYLAGTAAVLLVVFGTAFFLQHSRLAALEEDWTTIQPKVSEVEALQHKIRTFRPWLNESITCLTIARQLTLAFPEDGAVWAQSVGIKDLTEVTCSGKARSNRDWLTMLDKIRDTPGVVDLQVTQVKGNAPLQFTLNFQWSGTTDGL